MVNCLRAKGGPYGVQPARAYIDPSLCDPLFTRRTPERSIAAMARDLGVKASTLAAWLNGVNVPPAEVKLRLAELLGVPVERCWTADLLAATYVGPRGGCATPTRPLPG